MSASGLAAFGVLCALAGALITLAICARWAWMATGEGETVDTLAPRCIQCGARDVPLYDCACIPCRFSRDVPAGNK